MNYKEKLINFINRDVRFEDEPKHFFVVLRIYNIILAIYFFFFELISLLSGQYHKAFLMMPWILLDIISFATTYYYRTRLVFHIFSIINLLWIILFTACMGWGCSAQLFLFPLLVLSFFATYNNFKGKLCYTLFLLAVRFCIYFTLYDFEGIFPVTDRLREVYQILNMTFLFSCMFCICWNFSQVNQAAQEKLASYNSRLKHQADTDALTGLWNRRSMMDFLQKNTVNSPTSQIFSVAIGDIDFFKKINDTYGHNCGDEVLRRLGSLFKDYMKGKGMVCRWGGEEFFFVFPSANGDLAYTYILQLQNLIKKLEFTDQDDVFFVTMTFGVEEYGFDSSVTDLIKKADDKLYIGKNTGRNKVIY